MKQFVVQVASESHLHYANIICAEMESSAKARGTGIAKRTPQYIEQKMLEGKAVIALTENFGWAGFCYIETWSHGEYVANSGLIVSPEFRKSGLAKSIKKKIFELSRSKYPDAKIFGLTTGLAVMKINSELGYEPVTYSELTQDEAFWKGCQSCVNFEILQSKNRVNCLCTAMLFDPKEKINHLITLKTMNMKKKVVLAFSGGLDTSFCVVYLKNTLKLEVHAVLVNTGGFSTSEISRIQEKAMHLGAKNFTCLDETQHFYNKIVKHLIFGNVLKNNTYPLSVSAERISQAEAIAGYAKQIKADHIAHGSTGAGNDQVRFDSMFQILCPEISIITPIRDNKLPREKSIYFLQSHGYSIDAKKSKYSINKGIWGTSVGGEETLTSKNCLPESAFPSSLKSRKEKEVTLHFKKGELIGINEQLFTEAVQAIQALEKIASAYAIGRDIHVGDTIIGIKGRVGFEAAAALIIIKAHHTLEKHTLTKYQMIIKDQLSQWYGNWLHEGLYPDPVMRDIEQFFLSSQDKVSGKVFVQLHPYRFIIKGIESPHDLMNNKFGSYGEMNKTWSGDDVKGFTKIMSNSLSIYHQINKENGTD